MAILKRKKKRASKPKDEFTPEQRASFVVQPEDAVNPTAPVYEAAREANRGK